MSAVEETSPKPKRLSARRSIVFETVEHLSDEGFGRTRPALAALYVGVIREGLEDGSLVEVETEDARLIVPVETAAKRKGGKGLLVKGVLTPEQEDSLRLEETEDHILLLWKDRRVVAAFSQMGVTPESIRQEADRWMKGGDAIGDAAGDVLPASGVPAETAGTGEAGSGVSSKEMGDPRGT